MKKVKLRDYLANEIRMRFSTDSIMPYDDNKAIHKLLTAGGLENSEAEGMKLMNPNIIMMSKQLIINQPFEKTKVDVSFEAAETRRLLEELDIIPTKEDFQKIREKDINLALVGYGGAMINMLHNMYLWSMELGETRVFRNIVVFEKDTIDFSNVARLGKPIIFDFVPNFVSNETDHQAIRTLDKVSLITKEEELSKRKRIVSFDDWLQDKHVGSLKSKNYIIVGAPDLDTRQMLTENEAQFYFMGHSNYEVDITYQPEITSSLVVENYGSIDIPVLLTNLQLATAAFIKQLAWGEVPEKNQKVFNFDMKKYIEEHTQEKGEANV